MIEPASHRPGAVRELPFRSQRLGPLFALVWLGLAGLCVAGLAVAGEFLVRDDAADADRAMMALAVTVGAPGLLWFTWAHLTMGVFALRPRRGRIEVSAGSVVIHDRWLLRRPIVLSPGEIDRVRVEPRGTRHFRYVDSGERLVVGWSQRWNLEIHLRVRSVFPEAIRTPRPRGGLSQVSRNRPATALVVLMRDPIEAQHALSAALADAPAVAPQRAPQGGCSSGLLYLGLGMTTIVGFVIAMVTLLRSAG